MKSPPLIEYYEEIRNKAGIALDEKENMKRFNDIRRVFKHKGWIVSKSDIDTSKTNVLNIFQNTLLVFGIDFESLSLIEFVECSVVKELLFEAHVPYLSFCRVLESLFSGQNITRVSFNI